MHLKSLFSASIIVAAGTLAGRLLGLLREMLLASQFGVGSSADMAIVLLIIPDFITSALILGPAGATLIPAFAARDHRRILALFWQALLAGTAAFIVIALLLFLQVDHLSALMNPDVAALPHVTFAFFLAMCSLPMSAATSILTAYLQYRGRFVAPAFANAVFNVIIILTLWFAPAGLAVFAVGILVAGLVRLLAHIGSFLRAGDTFSKPEFSPWELRAPILKTYGITAASSIFNVLPFYAPYMVIAYMGSSVALFNYAFKLVLLPGLLFQSLVQMVLLPWLVRIRSGSDTINSHALTLQLCWIVSWVTTLSLSLVGPSLAMLCFGYGKMTAEDIAQVGGLFSIGVWAMPGMVLTSVRQQILYANERTGAALVSSALQAVLVIPLCWLGERFIGTSGVLAAYVVLQLFPVCILAREGHKRGLSHGLFPSWNYGRMTLAATVVLLPLAWVAQWFVLGALANVVVAMLIGLVSLGAGLLFCEPLKTWALQQVKRA